jgi:hypothetical protein
MRGTRRGNGESWISETPNPRGYFEAFVTVGTKPQWKARQAPHPAEDPSGRTACCTGAGTQA